MKKSGLAVYVSLLILLALLGPVAFGQSGSDLARKLDLLRAYPDVIVVNGKIHTMDAKLTQVQAADLLGIPQPKLSNMLRGQFRGISETKMIGCLTKLGRNVEIVVKSVPRSKATGRVSVVFA